jgi:hypothetical protein
MRQTLGLGVRGKEMAQHHEKLTRMILVAATQRVVDIVAHHVPDLLGAIWFFQQVPAHSGSRNFRYVLMLRNGHHFLFGQATEGNAVLKADHVESPLLNVRRDVRSVGQMMQGENGRLTRRPGDHETSILARLPPKALGQRLVECTVPHIPFGERTLEYVIDRLVRARGRDLVSTDVQPLFTEQKA